MKFVVCPICDQVYAKVVDHGTRVMCCNHSTEDIIKNNQKEQSEEHRPLIRKIGNFVTVTVGPNHPMIETHFISAIFLETSLGFQYKNIASKDEAKAEFILANDEEIINVYTYCNVHLLHSLH